MCMKTVFGKVAPAMFKGKHGRNKATGKRTSYTFDQKYPELYGKPAPGADQLELMGRRSSLLLRMASSSDRNRVL